VQILRELARRSSFGGNRITGERDDVARAPVPGQRRRHPRVCRGPLRGHGQSRDQSQDQADNRETQLQDDSPLSVASQPTERENGRGLVVRIEVTVDEDDPGHRLTLRGGLGQHCLDHVVQQCVADGTCGHPHATSMKSS